jgi:hypothetical protein
LPAEKQEDKNVIIDDEPVKLKIKVNDDDDDDDIEEVDVCSNSSNDEELKSPRKLNIR